MINYVKLFLEFPFDEVYTSECTISAITDKA